MKNKTNCHQTCFLAVKCQKCFCGQGSAPDHAGRPQSAPPNLLADLGGGIWRSMNAMRGKGKGGRRRRDMRGRKRRGREGKENGKQGDGYSLPQ